MLTHAAIQRLLADWPCCAPLLLRNIATMRRAGSCAEEYLARWEGLVRAGPDALAAAALAGTDEAQVLRSVHPFSGLLTPAERWAVLAQARSTTA